MKEFDLMVENAKLFNGNNDPLRIAYRAKSMRDVCFSMLAKLIDPEIDRETEKIAHRRRLNLPLRSRILIFPLSKVLKEEEKDGRKEGKTKQNKTKQNKTKNKQKDQAPPGEGERQKNLQQHESPTFSGRRSLRVRGLEPDLNNIEDLPKKPRKSHSPAPLSRSHHSIQHNEGIVLRTRKETLPSQDNSS